MYQTGFLGQLNMTFRASALALGLAAMSPLASGCGNESDTFGDGGRPPLDPPDGNDTTLPHTPENVVDTCLPVDSQGVSFRVLTRGTGVRLGTGAPVDGGFLMAMNELTPLTLSSGQLTFRGMLRWNSAPSEFVPGDGAVGAMGLRTFARLNGDPLTNANMTRAGMTGPWANQFPSFADRNRVGFIWPVEGILHFTGTGSGVSNCVVEMTIRSAARTTSGMGPSLDYGVFPFYTPRSDGVTDRAEADSHNETVAILRGPIEVVLPVDGTAEEVCAGDCTDINNASNPASIEMRLIRNPSTTSGSGGAGGSGGSGG